MRRTDRAAALLERQTRDGLVVPDYERYCFANVPGTVGDVLGVDAGRSLPDDVFRGVETDVSRVVVLLLDGLGWHRFHRDAADHRFLSRLAERGTVTPLTTVAPASTAAAIATLHTGAVPAEHGVYGWDQRLPDHEVTVEVFPHAVRGATADATPPVSAAAVVRATPVYPSFEATGVETRVVQPAETLGDAYGEATFRGATQVPYDDVTGGARALGERLTADAGPSYSYCYVPDLDAASHEFGADSGEYHDALSKVTGAFSRALFDGLDADTAG